MGSSAADIAQLCRDAIELEEQEAIGRAPNYNRIVYCQITKEIKDLMDQLRDATVDVSQPKAEGQNGTDQKPGADGDDPTKSEQFQDQRRRALMLLLELKKLNRYDKLQNRDHKNTVLQHRHKVDQLHMQLENLLYETTCLQKEINKCRDFKSKVQDIGLTPVEAFLQLESVQSEIESLTSDEHKLTLARLNHELDQRKALAGELKEAENRREQCFEQVEDAKLKLDQIHPKLKNIVDIVNQAKKDLEAQ